MPGILAFIEQRDGAIKKAGFEAAAFAARLAKERGTEVCAVLVGSGVTAKGAELGKYGIGKVLVADNDAYARYSTEAYAQALLKAAQDTTPDVVVLASTAMGKDLAPFLSAKLNAAWANEITELVSASPLKVVRPLYAGKLNATLSFTAKTVILGLRPNVFQASATGDAQAEVSALAVQPGAVRAQVKEVQSASSGRAELTEAEIVVSGGRGMKEPENFSLIEGLAAALGAAVGASRAVVDAGWRPHAEQVGQTGKVVTPNLYIACGISGAVQHLAGMSSSKVIVAINKDKDAPIFKLATYGIVGDALEVIPALTEEVKKFKAAH